MAKEYPVTSQRFRVGQWVVITEPGPYFGKTGDLVASTDKSKADWVVIVTAGGIGVGFDEEYLIPDPRVWC